MEEQIRNLLFIIRDDCKSSLKNSPQFSLLNGSCGIYLLLFLHSKIYNLDISKIENQFIKELTQSLKHPINTFSEGITGIGWALQLLVDEEIMIYKDVREVLEQIDKVSYEFSLKSLKENNHDFLYGSIGEMLYLLNRTKYNSKIKNYLTKIANKLIECSKTCKEGTYWNESIFMLESHQKSEEVINLGISHGQASKIVILSKLIEQGINIKKYSDLLRDVVRFTLNCKNKYTEETFFPSVIENGIGSNSSFWWSYGDIGIATALWQAGDVLKDEELKKEAETIFLYYSNTKIKETGIYEASLCRGTSGIALMYSNMYINTTNNIFKNVSDYWYNETLKLAKHDDGISGYKFLNNYSKNKEDWFYQTNPNIFMGSAGIGLSLLSYLSGKKLKWSECILLN
jgi:hypothetical protein